MFSAITNDKNLHPQELLSHSTDRPERQQLKEALEAMQVCATHTAFGHLLFICAVNINNDRSAVLRDDVPEMFHSDIVS